MAVPARCVNQVSGATISVAVSGLFGYLGAHWFTEIDPIQGGVFGAVSSLIESATKPIFNRIFAQPGANADAKLLGRVLNTAVALGLAFAICGALGYALTVETALTLFISQLVARLIGELICGPCP